MIWYAIGALALASMVYGYPLGLWCIGMACIGLALALEE